MKNISKFPKISMVVPTFNEERNIGIVLDSIFSQDYPKKLLEVFVVDNYSTDKTLEIAKKFPVKIIMNKIKDAQRSKMLAFKKSTGEYFMYIDADIEFRNDQYLKMMLHPFLDDKNIVGSFTRMYIHKKDGAITRYLTFDPLQRDVVYELFSPTIEEVITEKRDSYYLCVYKEGKIPPAGRCLFRVSYLKKTPILNAIKFMDLDNLVILVRSGFDQFAYVPQAGYYHHHATSFSELIRKRLRNIQRNYLPDIDTRYYKWFSAENPMDVLKIICLVIYANLFFPALIRGIIRSIKHNDIAGLLEPVVTIIVTDTIIYGFLTSSEGREIFKKMMGSVLKI